MLNVDATAVISAKDMGQALDQSGSITYNAEVLRRSLKTVITKGGTPMTALIVKTSPLPAIMIPVLEVWIIYNHLSYHNKGNLCGV